MWEKEKKIVIEKPPGKGVTSSCCCFSSFARCLAKDVRTIFSEREQEIGNFLCRFDYTHVNNPLSPIPLFFCSDLQLASMLVIQCNSLQILLDIIHPWYYRSFGGGQNLFFLTAETPKQEHERNQGLILLRVSDFL